MYLNCPTHWNMQLLPWRMALSHMACNASFQAFSFWHCWIAIDVQVQNPTAVNAVLQHLGLNLPQATQRHNKYGLHCDPVMFIYLYIYILYMIYDTKRSVVCKSSSQSRFSAQTRLDSLIDPNSSRFKSQTPALGAKNFNKCSTVVSNYIVINSYYTWEYVYIYLVYLSKNKTRSSNPIFLLNLSLFVYNLFLLRFKVYNGRCCRRGTATAGFIMPPVTEPTAQPPVMMQKPSARPKKKFWAETSVKVGDGSAVLGWNVGMFCLKKNAKNYDVKHIKTIIIPRNKKCSWFENMKK